MNTNMLVALITFSISFNSFAQQNESSGQPNDEKVSSEIASSDNSSKEEFDPNERICRRIQVTGSNFRRRVCQTRQQWNASSEDTQEFLRERNSGRFNTQGGPSQ
jgi:hypothetical protein